MQVPSSVLLNRDPSLTYISGNHDITLDLDFYADHGLQFHNQYPQEPSDCIQLLKDSPSITYLKHESAEIRLNKQNGPRTAFKVFGSPYSIVNGLWAFGYVPENGPELWDHIPLNTDIVITHTPPKYHCDESKDRGAAGCEALRQTLWRVRPRLAVCGHVHEGRGVERVLWDLTSPNVKYKEEDTFYWTDPGHDNNKQCLFDLSIRGGNPLENDGSEAMESQAKSLGINPGDTPKDSDSASQIPLSSASETASLLHSTATSESAFSTVPTFHAVGTQLTRRRSLQYGADLDNLKGLGSSGFPSTGNTYSTGRGQGGKPPSGRCDMEALHGRLGRKETCIINAAIKATNWPHKSAKGKKHNKPIVVDIDLPIWDDISD